MSRAIVTVGISDQRGFGPYHERFERTLGLNSRFSCADYVKRWENEWPPGSPTHGAVHYAFKVYAIWDAFRRGHTSILWLDVSCYAVSSLEPLWSEIESVGHFLGGEPALDPETGLIPPGNFNGDALGTWSSDKSLDEFGISRDDAMRVTLLCGTCIGLDLTNNRSIEFLNRLTKYAVPGHYNGTHSSGLLGRPAETEGKSVSDDPRCQGHRSDEVYMTLLARELKMRSSGEYFTGGNSDRRSTCIKSGYNLK